MTEHDFRFFESEWGLYKRATGVKNQALVDELWSCMSNPLKKLAFDQGDIENLLTEELMMTRIKSLAVAVLHTAIHTVRLHEATQVPDESVKTFSARVRGIASNCVLVKKCECLKPVSYLDETVYHVVLAGLRDKDMQEACTTQALLGNIKDIATLIEYCSAKESGQLGCSGTVGGVRNKSSYQSNKSQQRRGGSPPPPGGPCVFCGSSKGHSDRGKATREKECKAYTVVCTKCSKKGHYTNLCKSKPIKAAAVEHADTKDSKQEATNGAIQFGFYGIHSGSWDYPPAPSVCHLVSTNPVPTSNRFLPLYELGHMNLEANPATKPSQPGRRRSTPPSPRGSPTRFKHHTRSGRKIRAVTPHLPPIIAAQTASASQQYEQQALASPQSVPLCHMEHDPVLGWREAPPLNSPTVQVRLRLHLKTYSAMRLPPPSTSKGRSGGATKASGVTDTGAQMNILPVKEIEKLGIDQHSLLPVRTVVSGATKGSRLNILGAVFLSVKGMLTDSRETLQLFYVADNVISIYLSLSTLKALGIVPPDFPKIGMEGRVAGVGVHKCTNDGIVVDGQAPCTCPPRTLAPPPTTILPFPPTKDNVPRLKKWLLDRYSSSSFNNCEQQKLPYLQGSPPLKLHLDPQAKPVAVHVPAVVPIHWQVPVKAGLDRDCRLGVLERVPVNTPARWQHRMMVVAKHNGEPRRTVDFRNLNKFTPRQTHHTQSPWCIACSIPEGVYKTCFDAWHGYHSLELAEEDRELTTFITPYGRYRYLTLPQGVLSAGDAYTDRMDRLFEDFERTNRCIDDTAIWDESIEQQFFRTCQFLDRCANNGIILNASKFQFAQEELDYLGFRVTMTGVQPQQEFIDNILSFPTPKCLTDIRSWFGAVAQISYAYSTCNDMLPFKHLLSSKVPFSWSADLDKAFEASKREIVRQCREGVRSFNPSLPTCLATDWSKVAMGLWLCQKRCSCDNGKPGCCPKGWQTVYVSSRFCHQAEQNYAPIEGEAKAASWAADKCRFFLLGLPHFILSTDHKPLITMLNRDTELGSIVNHRIRKQKEKLLPFRFTPEHVPGKLNVIPDTWSRRSDTPYPTKPTMEASMLDISNIQEGYSSTFGPPSWVSSPAVGNHPPAHAQQPELFGQVSALCETLSEEESRAIEEEERLITDTGLLEEEERLITDLADLFFTDLSPELTIAAHHIVRVVTWDRVREAAVDSPIYKELLAFIKGGLPASVKDWPATLHPYHPYRHNLQIVDDLVLCGDRPLIPVSLRDEVLQHLHAAHSGSTTMSSRATQSVFWPGMSQEITSTRAHCTPCTRSAPSNPAQPAHPPTQPDFPFSHCCMDFFQVGGRNYLAMVDRYCGWLSVLQLDRDDSAHVISALREYFSRWGIAKELTSDGASVFTSAEIKSFFHRWGVKHRVSSSYYPRANKRSEVAVKSAKRVILDNLGPKGQLDTDKFARALLLHRNTPDPMTGLSPAMILFGRELRDHLPSVLSRYQPRQEWRMEADAREKAFAKRHAKMEERLNYGAKPLPPLAIGDVVTVQDQSDPRKPGKWTKTGDVIEILPHDSYMVRIHGSRAPTQRNRRFLRKISPFHPMIPVHHTEHLPLHAHPHGAPVAQEARPVNRAAAQAAQHPLGTQPSPTVVPCDDTFGQPIPGHIAQDDVPVAQTVVQPNPPGTKPPMTRPRLREKWIVRPTGTQGPPTSPPPTQPGTPRPAAATSSTAHRLQPAAAPGHDVLKQLKMREAMGHVLFQMMEYAATL